MSKQTKTSKSKKSDLTTTQKKKAAKGYNRLMTNIAAPQRFIEKYGEPLYYLKTFDLMNKNGLITDKQLDYMADMLLYLEILRCVKIRLVEMGLTEPKTEQEIDTSRLLAGMTVKNYKALCDLLGDEPKTGKAKQLQLKKWQNYFDFEQNKYSNEYIILEVYPEPLNAEQRKYRNSAYINELKVLILNKLNKLGTNSKGNIIYCPTFKELIHEMGIIDDFLTDKQYDFDIDDTLFDFLKQKFGDSLPDGKIKFNFAIFRNNTVSKIKESIKTALNALQRDDMISWHGQYVIVSRNSENGNTIYSVADDNQTAIITQTQKDVATELGYKNSFDAQNNAKKKYYDLFNACIARRLNCDYVYYQLKIVTTKSNLEKHIDEYTALTDNRSVAELTDESIKDFSLTFNENLTKTLRKKADTFQQSKADSFLKQLQKNSPEYSLDDLALLVDPLSMPEIARYDDSFREMYSRLIDLFVDKSSVDDDLDALHKEIDETQAKNEQIAINHNRHQRTERLNRALKNSGE